MQSPVFIFIGIGSEYVLSPLARHFKSLGHRSIECDMAQPDWRDRLNNLSDTRKILVASHHPFVDRHIYRTFYHRDHDVLSVYEMIEWLKPIASFFIPHDLTEPLKNEEICALPLFDAIFMPTAHYWCYQRHTQVVVAGWIKADPQAEWTETSDFSIAFMPTELGYYSRQGPELFLKNFGRLLECRPHVKFPLFPDLEPLIDIAESFHCRVWPAETTSSSIISQSDIVVTNACSSIAMEAALAGVPVICITDGVHTAAVQRSVFAAYPEIRIAACDEAASWLKQMQDDLGNRPKRQPSEILPFDFAKVTETVLHHTRSFGK